MTPNFVGGRPFPTRGMVFAVRGTGLVSKIVLQWQKSKGLCHTSKKKWVSHVGVVGNSDCDERMWGWESHFGTGVVYHPIYSATEIRSLIAQKRLYFLKPPGLEGASETDLDVAFSVLRAVWHSHYDIRWILSFGRMNREGWFMCAELVNLFCSALAKQRGAIWKGEDYEKFVPNHSTMWLDDATHLFG